MTLGLATLTRGIDYRPVGAIDRTPAPPAATLSGGGSPLAPASPGVAFAAGGNVSIDLEDADIATAAKAVLGDVLKADYEIDPNVQGKVTLKTGKPRPAAEALALFETSLAQNGVALVRSHGGYVIAPANQASAVAGGGIKTADSNSADAGFGARAVVLRHISAAEMADILSPLGKDAVLRVDKERNAIVLQGSGEQFEAAMETIRTFDVDWLANKSVGVFRLANASTENVSKALTEIMHNDNIDATMARFITLDASNTIVAVAKTPSVLADIRRWVARLDQAGRSALRLYAYEMRYARATRAASIVASALGMQMVAAASGDAKTGETRTASAATSPSATAGATAASASSAKSAAAPNPSPTASANLDPARAVLDAAPGNPDANAGAANPSDAARIVVDEVGNKLLIYARPDQYDRVRDVLRTVDTPQRQILVEASFVEVDLTDTMQYGAQAYLSRFVKGTRLQAQLTPNTNGVVGASGPGGMLTIGMDSQAIITALSTITHINVISSPHLLVTNDQSARLVVGDQVPVTTQSQNSILTNSVTVTSVDYRDTGIIFDVTPHITASGAISLDILQEVSSVKNAAQTTSLTPTISQRRVTSSVVAENNETIVIGGLFSVNSERDNSGLPGINRIPLLSDLLGEKTNTDSKTELLVLISPKIINNADDARRVTRELSDRITDLHLLDARSATAYPQDRRRPCPASTQCR